MNFEQVENDSQAAAEALRLCAFLAPDEIPQELLLLGAPELGAALAAALEGAAEDPLALDQLLEPLARYSLIDRDPPARRFAVHRMVQAVVRDALGEEDRRRWAERVVRALDRAFPAVEFPAWPLCERLLGQAAAALSLADRHGLELEEAGRLFNQAGIYTRHRGRYRAAEPLFERALRILEKALGPEHPRVATALESYALLLRKTGRQEEAVELKARAKAIHARRAESGGG